MTSKLNVIVIVLFFLSCYNPDTSSNDRVSRQQYYYDIEAPIPLENIRSKSQEIAIEICECASEQLQNMGFPVDSLLSRYDEYTSVWTAYKRGNISLCYTIDRLSFMNDLPRFDDSLFALTSGTFTRNSGKCSIIDVLQREGIWSQAILDKVDKLIYFRCKIARLYGLVPNSYRKKELVEKICSDGESATCVERIIKMRGVFYSGFSDWGHFKEGMKQYCYSKIKPVVDLERQTMTLVNIGTSTADLHNWFVTVNELVNPFGFIGTTILAPGDSLVVYGKRWYDSVTDMKFWWDTDFSWARADFHLAIHHPSGEPMGTLSSME